MQQQWSLLLASFNHTCAVLTAQHSNHVPQPELPTLLSDNVYSFTNNKSETPAPTAILDSIDKVDKDCAVMTDMQCYNSIQKLDPSPQHTHAQYYDSVQKLDPSPQHTHATLETIFQQSMSILDVAKQQSQALQNWTAKSEVLLSLMTRVASMIDHLALVPSPHSMTKTTITLPTVPAPNITK